MKILLLGANGQVGWELQRSLSPLGDMVALGRLDANLEDLEGLKRTVEHLSPDIIVNAAAYTAVDKAESEGELAGAINGVASGILAECARRVDAWLIHYSTDYVFDGSKQAAYLEEDKTNPLSIYGRSKLEGERRIQSVDAKHIILRTSWVYGRHGVNFPKTILRLAREKDELKVVSDQVGTPTSSELIADVTAHIVQHLKGEPSGETSTLPGVYHLASKGHTSWFDIAKYVVSEASSGGCQLKLAPENIMPISTAEYPVAATRPQNSLLNTDRIESTFGLCMPPWEHHMKRFMQEYLLRGV